MTSTDSSASAYPAIQATAVILRSTNVSQTPVNMVEPVAMLSMLIIALVLQDLAVETAKPTSMTASVDLVIMEVLVLILLIHTNVYVIFLSLVKSVKLEWILALPTNVSTVPNAQQLLIMSTLFANVNLATPVASAMKISMSAHILHHPVKMAVFVITLMDLTAVNVRMDMKVASVHSTQMIAPEGLVLMVVPV